MEMGLGVMGDNLALNLARNGFDVDTAHLLQAQRDDFGALIEQRLNRPGKFHTRRGCPSPMGTNRPPCQAFSPKRPSRKSTMAW